MADFDTIPPAGVSAKQFKNRVSKRDILPTNVQSRFLSRFVYGTEEAPAQTTLGNGEQAVITLTIEQNDGYELAGLPYIVVYIGSRATANQLPGGSNIDESQWQMIGPFYNKRLWDNDGVPKDTDFVTLYVRNISAGSQTVIIDSRWRYISPRQGA